jgi:hypothetical protein
VSKAAAGAAKGEWPKLKDQATEEFFTLAQVGARIEARKAAGTVTEDNARFLMWQYKNAVEIALLTTQGISTILVEEVINAALAVLRDAVSVATKGWLVI